MTSWRAKHYNEMETGGSFRIIVHSNEPAFATTNRLTDFKTLLPRPYRLQGKYEVALEEFSYPHTWNNLYHNDFVKFRINATRWTVHFRDAYYGSIDEINNEIRQKQPAFINGDGKFVAHDSRCSFKGAYALAQEVIDKEETFFDKNRVQKVRGEKIGERDRGHNRKTFIRAEYPRDGKLHIELSPNLAVLLGFDVDTYYAHLEEQGETNVRGKKPEIDITDMIAEFPYDMDNSLHTLYVYSDIVDTTCVGGVDSQLLRIINVNASSRGITMITQNFAQPPYVNVLKPEFQTIRVYIRDQAGRPVHFTKGSVRAHLHFRPVPAVA